MTPKEKAEELYNNFFEQIDHFDVYWDIEQRAKQCALICVDEITKNGAYYPMPNGYLELPTDRIEMVKDYWQQVKTEIEKL